MSERCLWTEASTPTGAAPSLPAHADVVVVGAGYTGLAAARELARRGTSVAVLEQHFVGWGASGRNGGFVLPGFKPDFDWLARKLGMAEACRLFGLSLQAVEHLVNLVTEENIDCDLVRCGSVTLAARLGHMRALERGAAMLRETVGHETAVLDAGDLACEIESTRYHGGVVDPSALSLHPVRYVEGLAAAARRAGATVIEGVEVTGIRREGGESVVETLTGQSMPAKYSSPPTATPARPSPGSGGAWCPWAAT